MEYFTFLQSKTSSVVNLKNIYFTFFIEKMLRSSFFKSSSSTSTSFLVAANLVLQQSYFRDNFAKNPPRHSKEKTRKDQLDNIFKTKQRHASEQKRVLSMESEVRHKPHQFQIQKQSSSRPAVSLLELDQEINNQGDIGRA